MKYKSRITLFLIFSAFVTTFCRCSLTSGTPVTLSLADGNTIDCREFVEYDANWSNLQQYSYSYDCSIPCPDGSTSSTHALRLPNIIAAYVAGDIVDLELATLQEQYCSVAVSTATSTPTLEPNTSNSIKVAVPLLTEKVTACDYKKSYVNFELADSSSEFDQTNTVIKLNDTPVDCSVPSNNKDILNCNLPAGVRFPIQVQVDVDQLPANSFVFDGSFCGYKDP